MALCFGILVFPGVQQLDLTGPYEVFASIPDATVHLIWKDRSPITSGSNETPSTSGLTGRECLPTKSVASRNPGTGDRQVLMLHERHMM